MHDALDLHELLGDELVQRRQSGYQVSTALADRILVASTDHETPAAEVEELYNELESAPLRPGWEYEEPTVLDHILDEAPGAAASEAPDDAGYGDRVLAAWLGRCAGCNLGKPVEGHGWNRAKLRSYLEEVGAFPLDDYIPVPDEMPDGYTLNPSWAVATRGRVRAMARDDDLDYTMLGLRVLETYGRGYTSRDVAQEWLRGMPFQMVYTAERVAYRNLVRGVQPPATASRRNPYREWIGAMIRADIFGYVSPGQPQARRRPLLSRRRLVPHGQRHLRRNVGGGAGGGGVRVFVGQGGLGASRPGGAGPFPLVRIIAPDHDHL